MRKRTKKTRATVSGIPRSRSKLTRADRRAILRARRTQLFVPVAVIDDPCFSAIETRLAGKVLILPENAQFQTIELKATKTRKL